MRRSAAIPTRSDFAPADAKLCETFLINGKPAHLGGFFLFIAYRNSNKIAGLILYRNFYTTISFFVRFSPSLSEFLCNFRTPKLPTPYYDLNCPACISLTHRYNTGSLRPSALQSSADRAVRMGRAHLLHPFCWVPDLPLMLILHFGAGNRK